MSYTIRYLKSTENDLYEIFDYIKNDNPDAALGLLDKIESSISKLADNPKIGPVPKDVRLQSHGYRMLVIDNYIVFYVVKKKVLQIRKVLHGARNYSFLF